MFENYTHDIVSFNKTLCKVKKQNLHWINIYKIILGKFYINVLGLCVL